MSALGRTIEDNSTAGRNAGNLKSVLAEMQSFCRDFHGRAPFLSEDELLSLPERAAVVRACSDADRRTGVCVYPRRGTFDSSRRNVGSRITILQPQFLSGGVVVAGQDRLRTAGHSVGEAGNLEDVVNVRFHHVANDFSRLRRIHTSRPDLHANPSRLCDRPEVRFGPPLQAAQILQISTLSEIARASSSSTPR